MANENLDVTFYIFPTHRERHVEGLQDLIEDYGGVVVDLHKQRIQDIVLNELDGYILIDPSQRWAPAQLSKKTRQDRYNGMIVHYINWGYPRLCIKRNQLVDVEDARRLLIFNRTPAANGGWSFYFFPTLVRSQSRRQKNEDRVTDHGGEMAEIDEANIVIVPHDALEEERDRFENNPFTRVESKGWLLDSITAGYIQFTAPPGEPLPGRTPIAGGWRYRTSFTEQEKNQLVKYLALNSNENLQGLQGNVVYKDMCSESSPEYRWSQNHPWQSWQNQYKKNKPWYNAKILDYQQNADLPFVDSHGRDRRNRMNNRRPVKIRVNQRNATRQDDETDSEQTEEDAPVRGGKRHRLNKVKEERVQKQDELTEEDMLADDNSGPQEFDDFADDIAQQPRSTPPRVDPATFDSSRSTLVSEASLRPKDVPAAASQARPITALASQMIYREGGLFVPFTDDEDEEENSEDELEDDTPPEKADSDAEQSIQESDLEDSMDFIPPDIPHLDMVEERNKQKIRSAKRLSKVLTRPEVVSDNSDNDNVPAREFKVSGRSTSVFTPRSERPAQLALRESGIFPASKSSKRAANT